VQWAWAVLSSVTYLAPQYLINGTILGGGGAGKVNGHKMCVLFFFKTFVWNISH